MNQKSLDLQKQLIELVKATNLQEMNKKELEIAQQLLETQTKDLENTQKLTALENKLWLLQRHTKQIELKNTLTQLKDYQQYLQLLKQRDIQEIEMQVIKGQKMVNDYMERQEDEYQKLVDEKERLVRSINSYRKE